MLNSDCYSLLYGVLQESFADVETAMQTSERLADDLAAAREAVATVERAANASEQEVAALHASLQETVALQTSNAEQARRAQVHAVVCCHSRPGISQL
jgi:septation ring formation regulator EzrA